MLKRNIFKFITFLLLMAVMAPLTGQNIKKTDHPKLIVGVVVDQMRWDYLYRFQDRYTEGGFKRMLREGFSCENTQINYTPTVTAAGHSCVYTGSVPAIHGIVGNSWYDRDIKREVNNVEDTTVQNVGAPQDGYSRSPRKLLTTTIGDQLKLSNNFKSKVIGVSFKDRGAILPAGHLSNGSFWYDNGTGHFITSTYYMDELPGWMKEFNARNLPTKYMNQTWETLYPIETYTQSTEDNKAYEGTLLGKKTPTFPYDFASANADFGDLKNSPWGNTITFDVARAAIEGEYLGEGEVTDMIAISLSTPDGLGHTVGPNAIEIEDMYLRLDKEFAAFFDYLDQRYGTNGYLFFVTADHGVAHSPGFLKEHKLPTGVYGREMIDDINAAVMDEYGIEEIIEAVDNFQLYIYWDHVAAHNTPVDHDELIDFIIRAVKDQASMVDAWPSKKLGMAPWPEPIRSRYVNGYNAQRGGDIALIVRPGWKGGSERGATHGTWYPYDNHIPLVWMGWNIEHGETNRRVGMTDIAPTVTALLNIQMPSGCIGDPILEITDR